MSLRSFIDSEGHEWEAFDVVPQREERRDHERRRGGPNPLAPDDRRDFDRRITVGRSPTLGGSDGWLCFERGTDRRRLAPIPNDWTRCDDAQLERYCQSARPVRRGSLSLEQIGNQRR
jgi:hypothetical protein